MSDLNNLFRPFIATHNKDNWAGYTSPRMGFHENVIPGVRFGAGFLVGTRPGTMDVPHIHDGAYNYFIFTGADLENIFESEFAVDFFLGDSSLSMEVLHITKPSFVVAPPGVFHSPVYFKKVVRGINNMLWYGGHAGGRIYPTVNDEGKEEVIFEEEDSRDCIKDPKKKCSYCGFCYTDPNQTEQDVIDYVAPYMENLSTEGKYKNNVMELRKDYHKLGDAIKSPRAVFKGVDDMPDTDRQLSFNIVTAPCQLGDDEPWSNGQVPEFLWFSGTDVVDAWDCFDAEIEIMLGEDPDNMQKVTFDKPGVVVVPPGMWRGAINVKRVGKPLCFIPWYPHNKKRYKITQKVVDGKKILIYDDETTITEPTAGDELYLQIKR